MKLRPKCKHKSLNGRKRWRNSIAKLRNDKPSSQKCWSRSKFPFIQLTFVYGRDKQKYMLIGSGKLRHTQPDVKEFMRQQTAKVQRQKHLPF